MSTVISRSRSSARLTGALAAASIAVLALTSCASPDAAGVPAAAEGPVPISFKVPWYPNAQGGGWYAAEVEGLYEEADLEVTLVPGGPEVQAISLLTSGQVDLATMTAEDFLQARAEGIPLVTVGATFDLSPTGVMVKADTGWTEWEDLAGKTWSVYLGSLGYQAVQNEYDIEFQTQASTGIAPFLELPDLVQQAYPTNETYLALKEGVETTFFPYYTAGSVAHADLIVATEEYLEENAETVAAFLDAGFQGWSDYMSDVEVATQTHEELKTINDQLVDDVLWYAWDKQREYVIGENSTFLGDMNDERWQDFADLLLELGVLTEPIDLDGAYTTEYLSEVPTPVLAELPAAPADSYIGQE